MLHPLLKNKLHALITDMSIQMGLVGESVLVHGVQEHECRSNVNLM